MTQALLSPSMTTQPQQVCPIDRSTRFGAGALAVVTPAMDINWVTGAKLTRGGAGPRSWYSAGLRSYAFNKDWWLETETLPVVGTKSLVMFWVGWPTAYGCPLSANDCGFVVGTSNNTVGLMINNGGSRTIVNPPANANYWGGCMGTWANIYTAGESLTLGTSGAPYVLMVVRKSNSSTIEFWRNGVMVNSASATPVNLSAAFKMEVGTWIANASWNSGANTTLAGLSVFPSDPTNAELAAFSANPWGLFKAPPSLPYLAPVLAASTTPGGSSAVALIEAVNAVDLTSAVYFSAAQVAEILAATESNSGSLMTTAAASEALIAVEALTAQQTTSSASAEALSAQDTLASQLQGTAAHSDSLVAAESGSSQLQTAASVEDALVAMDSRSSQLQASTSVVEALAALDALSAQATMAVQLLEAGAAADSSYTGAAAVQATTQDSLAAVDVLASVATLQAALAEGLTAADATTGSGQYFAARADALAALDQPATGTVVYSVVVGDTLVMIDTNSTVSQTSAAQVEALVAVDLVELEQSGSPDGEPVPSVSVEIDLHKALVSGVVACNLGVPLTAPNLPFTRPADGSPWVVVTVENDKRVSASLGTGGFDLQEGTLEVAINTAALRGTAEVRAIESRLAEGFRTGRTLVYGSATAMVTGFGDVKDEPTPGHFSRVVKIYWQAYVARPI